MKLDIALWQYFRKEVSKIITSGKEKEFTVAIPNLIDSVDRELFAFLNPVQDTIASATKGAEKGAEFADIANCISDDPLLWQFNPENQLSDVYSHIINGAEFLDDANVLAKLSNTKTVFENLHTQKDGDFDFVSTLCKPRELYKFDIPEWKKIIFTGAEIERLEQEAKAEVSETDYNRVSNDIPTPDLDIKEVSFEYITVNIVRDWFDEELIRSRAWRYDPVLQPDKVLSKGFDEFGGEMPAYPVQLFFTRNVTVTLKPDSLKNTQFILQLIRGQVFIGRNMFGSISQNTDPKGVTRIGFSKLTQKDKSVLTTQYKIGLQNTKLYLPTTLGVGTKVIATSGTTGIKVSTATTGTTIGTKVGSVKVGTTIGTIGTAGKTKVTTIPTGSVLTSGVLTKPTNVVLVKNSSILTAKSGILSRGTGTETPPPPKAKIISDSYFSRIALFKAAVPAKTATKTGTSAVNSGVILADWRKDLYVPANNQAKHSISGKLLDNKTGAILPNFKLELLSGDTMVLNTRTDNNGIFQFQVRNTGDYKIKILSMHYAVKAPSTDLILKFDPTTPDEESPIYLHAVVLKRLPKLPNPVVDGKFL
jgi:hypothetical protein